MRKILSVTGTVTVDPEGSGVVHLDTPPPHQSATVDGQRAFRECKDAAMVTELALYV